MNHLELDLYSNSLVGGKSQFNDEIELSKNKQNIPLNENDKRIIRLYKKRIIEQRNEINELKKEIKQLKSQ
tara:strand:- start:328 stop:540 length:213 start_codon:yes stop_codon:yes gene_type:complete